MTEYQKVFLFYVFIYYLLKGGICAACYLALKVMIKKALERKEQFNLIYMQKRADEEEKWKTAYRSEDSMVLKPLDQLVTNPKSFTTYSNVGNGYLSLGYRHRMFANGSL